MSVSPDEMTLLTLAAYQAGALRTDQGADGRSVKFPLLGLFGEVGSLLSELKKKQRDQIAYLGYEAAVEEELGDVLWYFSVFASRTGLSLAEIAAETIAPLKDGAELDFSMVQPDLAEAEHAPTPAFEETLLQLAGTVGDVVSGMENGALVDDKPALKSALVAVFSALVRAADEASVSLGKAASLNFEKTTDRWPETRVYPRPFDEESVAAEQLPRTLTVEVFERDMGGNMYVYQRCNNINIGDRLTDNTVAQDDYRFHDVFHYAYAAILTWSPVTRALLRLKRKSIPALDEGEDGARAILTEEGVSALIFESARKLDWFRDMEPGELSLDFLKNVREFVGPYEAGRTPLWLWEEAILAGYGAFRFLQKHRRARVHLDMNERKMTWETLPL